MTVSLIVAHDHNRGIGYQGKIPWNIPADLSHFRKMTMGHPVIMGVNTWKSLPTRPLDGRQNIVVYQKREISKYTFGQISLDSELREKKILVCETLLEAVDLGKDLTSKSVFKPEVFIIGGAKIYKEALARGLVDKIYLTLVHGFYPVDTFFPTIQAASAWKIRKTYDDFEFDRYEYTLT